MTLEQQLTRYNERSPGFDVCRLVLAFVVMASHSVPAAYGLEGQRALWTSPLGAPLSAIMPMFFALSGFLVMGSLVRMNDLRSFIAARGLRIVPALLTEIVISSLLLGPILTELPLWDYLTNAQFFLYFLNITGYVSYSLPGVFTANPYPNVVNGSLWTIPPEITCYLYLCLMMLFRFRLSGYVMAALGLFAANVAYDVIGFLRDVPVHQVLTSRFLCLSFCFGNILYILRGRIPFRFDLFAAATALGLLMLQTNVLVAPAVLCLSYSIVYIGCSGLKLPVDLKGDYSYGIYLYGFPVQQAVASLLPGGQTFIGNLLISLPITCLCAVASWWLVEKRVLDLRKLLPKRTAPVDVQSLGAMLLSTIVITLYAAELMRNSHFPDQEVTSDRTLVLLVSVSIMSVFAAGRWLMLRRPKRCSTVTITGAV
jgi:peptidoglycan/LPS O-acetylase OafA/YrhL